MLLAEVCRFANRHGRTGTAMADGRTSRVPDGKTWQNLKGIFRNLGDPAVLQLYSLTKSVTYLVENKKKYPLLRIPKCLLTLGVAHSLL